MPVSNRSRTWLKKNNNNNKIKKSSTFFPLLGVKVKNIEKKKRASVVP